MKKALLLIFGILTAITAICQTYTLQDGTKIIATSDAPGTLITIGEPKDIVFAPGVTYKFVLIEVPNNTAGKTIKISEVGGTTPGLVLKETVNDHDARITYSSGWTKQAGKPWTVLFNQQNWSQTEVVNSWATMTFTGKRLEVIAELRENHGVAKIEVLNGTTVIASKTVDMFKAVTTNVPESIGSVDVPQGTYTARLLLNSVSGAKDSMVFDGFRVYE